MSCLEPPFWLALILAAVLLPCLAEAEEFRIVPSIAQALQYSDNVFISSSQQVHDYISATTGGLELFDSTEKLNLDLAAQFTQNLYKDNTGLDSTEGLGTGSIRYFLNPQLALSAAGSYDTTAQPGREVLTTGLVLNGVTMDSTRYHAQVDYTLTEKTAASLSYDHGTDHYQSHDFSDLTSDSGTLSLNRDLGAYLPQAKGLLNMSYSKYTLTGAEIDNYEASAGFSYSLQEKWSIQVTGGLRRTDSSFQTLVPIGFIFGPFFIPTGVIEQTTTTSGWGAVGQASISYKGEVTNASLAASRDISPASALNGTVERTSFVLSADRRFTYDLHGSVSTGFFINKSSAGQFSTAPIYFETLNIGPALRYEFGREWPGGSQSARDMYVEASYTFTRVQDKEANTTGSRNLFMVRFFAQHAFLE